MFSKIKFLEILEKIISENKTLKEKECLENIKKDIFSSNEEITAVELIKKLDLIHLNTVTNEDGYFREFINTIDNNEQESQTEIFYLLKGKQVSCLHSLDITETWRWIGGKEISIFIFKEKKPEKIILNESNPSTIIEKGALFGAKINNLEDDNEFVLVTCLCNPGFVPEHYKKPSLKELDSLLKTYPSYKQVIKELAPEISKSNNITPLIARFFPCCINIKKKEDKQIESLLDPLQNSLN